MSKHKRKFIFERFSMAFLPLALLAKGFGYQVFYLTVSAKVLSMSWFERFQKRWQINKALEEELDYRVEVTCHYAALKTVEAVYDLKFKNHGLLKTFAVKLQSEKIHLTYKKVLVEELHHFYRVKATLKKIRQNSIGERIIFVPNDFLMMNDWIQQAQNNEKTDLGADQVVVPWWVKVYCALLSLGRKLAWLGGFAIFPLWIFSRIRRIYRQRPPKKSFQVGIRIYITDFGFRFPYRSIDFLLDDRKITKDNTLFCVETEIAEEYRRQLKEKSYQAVDLPMILQSVSAHFFGTVLLKDFLSFWLVLWKDIFFAPVFVMKTTLKNLRTYFFWKRFTEEYSLKHLVVYNDFGEQHVIRNIVLSRNNTQSWYYLHSRNSDDVFAPENKRDQYVYVSFSYLYYDNFVRWSRNIENYYKPHCIQKFLDLGCLWSEHIRLISQRPDFHKIREGYSKRVNARTNKIIAVFDTSFGYGDGYVLQPQDMILFTEDILRLLEDFPDTLVIFKEKNIRSEVEAECPQILPIYEKLAGHQRCYFSGWHADASEINAVSDLSITACFSSTTVEALGARKKAIYYDPNGFLKGTYYDKFPNLVAHSYAELKALVQHYLYEVSEKEFNRWIDTVIIDEVDAFADGQAITRLRDLLTSTTETKFLLKESNR